jgi:hypothetical protein
MQPKNELIPVAAFGWKPDVVNNGILYDDTHVLFVANKLLVLDDFYAKTQEVADLSYSSFASAIALSENKRMVAVSQFHPYQKSFIEILSLPFSKKFILSASMIDANVFSFFFV